MKFVATTKGSIKADVKKLFPCEAMSNDIYECIVIALDEGRMPTFNDISCKCINGSKNANCSFSCVEIEEILRLNGVLDRCSRYILPDYNDVGEWK